MLKWGFALVVCLLTSSPAQAAIHTQDIVYRVGNTQYTGYLAYDDAIKAKRPGILIMAETEKKVNTALDILRSQPTVDSKHLFVIGYCMGGGIAMAMARRGMNVEGVAVFHGSLGTDKPAKPGDIKARILVMTGADDPFVPTAQVQAFEQEMRDAKVNYQLIRYPQAMHAFTNPAATELGKRFNLPMAYNELADRDSWKQLLAFLRQ
jgi:dienelactone hydrolase